MFKLFTSAAVAVHQNTLIAAMRNLSTHGGPLLFRASTPLFGEPLKKKKRLDPQILKAREDRKRKKIEKSIRKLEKVLELSQKLLTNFLVLCNYIIINKFI